MSLKSSECSGKARSASSPARDAKTPQLPVASSALAAPAGKERRAIDSRLETGYFFDGLCFSQEREIVTTFLDKEGLRIERIASCGQSSGLYCQAESEWILLLKGEAILEIEGEIVELKTGDYCLIPAGRQHYVRATSENCVWLCVFGANGRG